MIPFVGSFKEDERPAPVAENTSIESTKVVGGSYTIPPATLLRLTISRG